jgi:hypothetical protein
MALQQRVQNNKIREMIYYEFHPELEQRHHYLRMQYEETLVISFATEEEFDTLINYMFKNACYFYQTGMQHRINLQKPPIYNKENARPFRMKYYWALYDYIKAVENIIKYTI